MACTPDTILVATQDNNGQPVPWLLAYFRRIYCRASLERDCQVEPLSFACNRMEGHLGFSLGGVN